MRPRQYGLWFRVGRATGEFSLDRYPPLDSNQWEALAGEEHLCFLNVVRAVKSEKWHITLSLPDQGKCNQKTLTFERETKEEVIAKAYEYIRELYGET